MTFTAIRKRSSFQLRAALVLFGLFVVLAQARAQSYTFQNAQIIGGGYVDAIVAHPNQSGLFYARTDVGGAYRYNSSTSTWVPLTDWVTPAEWQYMGIESLAIDPRDTSKLYLAAGMYTENWDGNGAILISSNQGASFSISTLPFRMGGNDNGRNGGERLQVDPNLGSILFYGTYNNGLWKSTNSGTSWSQVTSFPVTGSTDGAGVIFVAFDQNSGTSGTATPNIYVGVSTATGSNLYETTNGGTSWTAVAGQPTGLFPNHGLLGTDRLLYITYGNNIGPAGMTSGKAWRLHTTDNYWTDITPPNPNNYSYGIGGLAIDTEQHGRVILTTMDRYYPGDTLFLSTNANGTAGTVTWNDVGSLATRNSSLSPWLNFGGTSAGIGNWMSAVAIDPYNQDHAMYGTGGTVWTTSNLQNADSNTATSWTVGAKGIEETVASALMSPSAGPPLVSGTWDLGGFVHTSLTSSPAAGMFENPRLSKGTGLDYAKTAGTTLVRVGTAGAAPYGAYSTNSGSTWTPFATPSETTAGGGTVAISADAGTIVWAPSDTAPLYSTNNGQNWTATTLPTGVQVLSDGSSATLFYAYDASTGKFYASSNKSVSWYNPYSSLPTGGLLATVYGKGGEVWLASSSGIYHSTSSGSTWSQVSSGNVTSAKALGFGKALAGTSYPAMYLIGTSNGVTGIFRSTNMGATWQQINSASTQWGTTYFIIGDPKTAGNVYIGTSGRGIIYGTSPN